MGRRSNRKLNQFRIALSIIAVVTIAFSLATFLYFPSDHKVKVASDTFNPGPFSAPEQVAFTPGRAWIADPASNAVYEVSLKNHRVVQKLLGSGHNFSGPYAIAGKGDRVYVAGEGPDSRIGIAILNTNDGKSIGTLELVPGLPTEPRSLAICGDKVWYISPEAIEVFDAITNRMIRVLSFPGLNPSGGLAVQKNEYLWLAGSNAAIKVSCNTYQVMARVVFEGTVDTAEGVVVADRNLWVSTDSSLLEFDLESDRKLRSIPLVGAQLGGASIASVGKMLCVGNSNGDGIDFLSSSDERLIARLRSKSYFAFGVGRLVANKGRLWMTSSTGSSVVAVNSLRKSIELYIGPTGGTIYPSVER